MYLNQSQIDDMARAALATYEVTADWRSGFDAAREYALEVIGVRPNRTAVLLAVKIAKVKWMVIVNQAKREVQS